MGPTLANFQTFLNNALVLTFIYFGVFYLQFHSFYHLLCGIGLCVFHQFPDFIYMIACGFTGMPFVGDLLVLEEHFSCHPWHSFVFVSRLFRLLSRSLFDTRDEKSSYKAAGLINTSLLSY